MLGSLKNYFAPGSLSVSMNLTTVNSGNGLIVTPPTTGGVLSPFQADAVAGIAGSAGVNVPEPTSFALLFLGLIGAGCIGGRKRC
jgi:hypothetical protein